MRSESKTIVDKGDLGKYERQGRFLKPVLEIDHQGWSNGHVAPDTGVKNAHRLNGKAYKNIGRKRAY